MKKTDLFFDASVQSGTSAVHDILDLRLGL